MTGQSLKLGKVMIDSMAHMLGYIQWPSIISTPAPYPHNSMLRCIFDTVGVYVIEVLQQFT